MEIKTEKQPEELSWWETLRQVYLGWFRFECTPLAASVAFFAALSLFPLLLLIVAGLGFFFEFTEIGGDAREQLVDFVAVQYSVEVSKSLEVVFAEVQGRAIWNGPMATLGLLFTASLVFTQIDNGFGRIWELRRRRQTMKWYQLVGLQALVRARSGGMVLGMVCLLALLFLGGILIRPLADTARTWFPEAAPLFAEQSPILGWLVTVIVFTLVYRILSKGPVSWSLCAVTGVFCAVLWEVGSRMMGALSFGENFTVYGVIGTFLVILVWIYYNVMVLFLGALVVRVRTHPLEVG